ncbi:MAG: ATP synthase subunit C [Candidatus Freyarchaeum deiterrae]
MNKTSIILLVAVAVTLAFALVNTFVVAQGTFNFNFTGLPVYDAFGKISTGLGAGLAVGLAGLGAGLGMGTASAAAIGAISEKPEVFGRSIIYIVLIEAIAIYGFVISFLLIGKL